MNVGRVRELMKTDQTILNAFSIDVEGFVESNVQSFHIDDKYVDRAKENEEIQDNTVAVLKLLEELNTKATFFFVGRLARDIPSLIRQVAQAGHEIGCHNFEHLRVFQIAPDEFRSKLGDAKKLLEDAAGQEVYGFRAPDFSITNDSIWALDVLKELGFVYDSSIYPFGLHDVYGIKDAQTFIHKLPNGLIEVPMSIVEILGRRVPFGGGGYFRLYPLWLTRHLIRKTNKLGLPCVSYIHPYEVGPVIPRIAELSAYRKFRHYYHCRKGYSRTKKLLESLPFGPIIEIIKNAGLTD